MIAAGVALGGLLVWALGLTDDDLSHAVRITPRVLAYCLAVSAMLVFVIRMRDLIGGEVFVNFLVGRYHQPVREERIFLFLDVMGSTAFAETHGDLKLRPRPISARSSRHSPSRSGAMPAPSNDYIGDMAMVTWPMARGLKDARCVACVFDVMDRLDAEAEAEAWTAASARVPRLRAALHGGAIVTAEVGVDRHKIAYFGDAVNVTSRIESLCRPLKTEILVSDDLLARLDRLPQASGRGPSGRMPCADAGSRSASPPWSACRRRLPTRPSRSPRNDGAAISDRDRRLHRRRCLPGEGRDLRVAARYGLHVFVVANAFMALPREPWIERVVVSDGFDAADDWIAERHAPAPSWSRRTFRSPAAA